MKRFLEIRVSLSDDLCSWVESLVHGNLWKFSVDAKVLDEKKQGKAGKPAKKKPEQKSMEEQFNDSLTPPAPTPHPKKGTIEWPEEDVDKAYLRLYHKTVPQLHTIAEGIGIDHREVDGMTRDQMISLFLKKRYGKKADPYHHSTHINLPQLEPHVMDLLEKQAGYITTTKIRETLFSDGVMFNPQRLYDLVAKFVRNGIVLRDSERRIKLIDADARAAADFKRLSNLAKHSITGLNSKRHSLSDVARIVMDDLSMDDDSDTFARRLAAILTHIASNGICPVLSLGKVPAEEWRSKIEKKCSKLLTERLERLTS